MVETKKGWHQGRLGADDANKLFAHCTGVGPSQIRKAGGLDPKFSAEDIIEGGNFEGNHRLVYAFVCEKEPPDTPPKGARTFGWAKAGGYMYTFKRPEGTRYVSHRGMVAKNEVTFPDLVPFQDLSGYKIGKGWDIKSINMEGNGSCCYITSATCAALGLDDDCEVLRVLRGYRDEVLMADDEGRRAVERYYETAPAIVEAIDAAPDSARQYQEIFSRHLAPAVDAVRDGRHAEAFAVYRAMVEDLERRFGTLPHATNSAPDAKNAPR